MRFLILLLAAVWWSRPAAAQAPTPPLAPEAAALVGTYRLTYQPDSTDAKTRTEILYLWLGKTLSQFQSQGQQTGDSLVAALEKLPFNQETANLLTTQYMSLPHSRFSYIIYKTTAPRRVYCYDNIGLQHYRYEEPADVFTWTITPATATVAGYACQRATISFGGRQWEAWFTREVPVSDGPYKFCGLPGLIVQVGDTRQRYVFELVKLRKLAAPVAIALPEARAKPISRADFLRGKAEYDRNAFTQMLAGGGFRFNSPEDAERARQKARDNTKRRNNPLELR